MADTGTVGFIGLGTMGAAMARRIVEAGINVIVYNRTAERMRPLVEAGASSAAKPGELVDACDVIVSCLRDDAAVASVYEGDDGLAANARSGQVLCEHGTYSPATARRIAARAEAREATFLDAPVSGGPEGARRGELTAMVGGDRDALEYIRPVLSTYASSVRHIGPTGNGLELKLVNQLLVTVHIAAAAEAAQLIDAFELDPSISDEVLRRGWAASTMLSRTLALLRERQLTETGATVEGLIEVQAVIAEALSHTRSERSVFDAAHSRFLAAGRSGAGRYDPAVLASTQFPADLSDQPSSGGTI